MATFTKDGTSVPELMTIDHKSKLTLLDAVTTDQSSSAFPVRAARRVFKCNIAGTGAVSATILWYGNIEEGTNTNGVLLATSTLSGTTTDQTGADIPGEWPYVYCVLSGITGTGAKVTAKIGA